MHFEMCYNGGCKLHAQTFFYINDGDQTLNFLLMNKHYCHALILQLVGSCGKVMGSTTKTTWSTTILH